MFNLLITALLTFVASIIGMLAGFGISTIMLPVLVTFLPTSQAILIVGIIHWFNGLWKMLFFKKGIDRSLIIYFGIPSMLASIIGALFIMKVPIVVFHKLLGLFLMMYVSFLWWNPSFAIPRSLFNTIFGGILSGFSAGFFGIRGAITSSFLIAYDLPKEIYLATIGAIALIVDSTRLVTYWFGGMQLSLSGLIGLLIFVPISFLGAYVGSLLVDKIPQKQFRSLVTMFIGFLGIKLFFGL